MVNPTDGRRLWSTVTAPGFSTEAASINRCTCRAGTAKVQPLACPVAEVATMMPTNLPSRSTSARRFEVSVVCKSHCKSGGKSLPGSERSTLLTMPIDTTGCSMPEAAADKDRAADAWPGRAQFQGWQSRVAHFQQTEPRIVVDDAQRGFGLLSVGQGHAIS